MAAVSLHHTLITNKEVKQGRDLIKLMAGSIKDAPIWSNLQHIWNPQIWKV